MRYGGDPGCALSRSVGVPLLPPARPGDPKAALLSPHAGVQSPVALRGTPRFRLPAAPALRGRADRAAKRPRRTEQGLGERRAGRRVCSSVADLSRLRAQWFHAPGQVVSEHQPLGRRRRRRRVRGSAGGGDLSAGATGAASAGDGGDAVPEQLAALEGLRCESPASGATAVGLRHSACPGRVRHDARKSGRARGESHTGHRSLGERPAPGL
mmetsp:Transcript_130258/g.309087  ORF Transcript_130258/g.309087 Transcript_130258/m.309087 type:complete len:212 (-) Transcript_130258:144-779(-)